MMERGRGRQRRSGGGGRRPFRGRGSGGDRDYSHRGHRGDSREQAGPPDAGRQEAVDGVEVQKESEDQSASFSKRKILSNWDRYEATEKVQESEEVLQRGTDYHVLLTSAGDAFTQFRFAEEKEWGAETLAGSQDASMFPDFQCLIKALQELPLHLRLNLEADLVQEEVPQELPQTTMTSVSNIPQTFTIQKSTPERSTLEAKPQPEVKSEPSNLGLPGLEDELDLLLSLDAPVREEPKASPAQIREHDHQVTSEEPAGAPSDKDACLAAEEKPRRFLTGIRPHSLDKDGLDKKPLHIPASRLTISHW